MKKRHPQSIEPETPRGKSTASTIAAEEVKIVLTPREIVFSPDASRYEKQEALRRLIFTEEEIERSRIKRVSLGFVSTTALSIDGAGFFQDFTSFTEGLLSTEELQRLRTLEDEAVALREELQAAYKIPRTVGLAMKRLSPEDAMDKTSRRTAATNSTMRISTIQGLRRVCRNMNDKNRALFLEIDRRIAERIFAELVNIVAKERELWERLSDLQERGPDDSRAFIPSRRILRIANSIISLTEGMIPVSQPLLPSEFLRGKITF